MNNKAPEQIHELELILNRYQNTNYNAKKMLIIQRQNNQKKDLRTKKKIR